MVDKTIYISIPSIEDVEVLKTIENAFSSSDIPERVFIGISVFDRNEDIFLKIKEMKNVNISSEYTKLSEDSLSIMGTGNGRYRAVELYSGQDFILQIDSHTMFLDGWDTSLINLFEEFKSDYKSDKFVFTGYLPGYRYEKDGSRVSVDNKLHYPYFLPNNFYLKQIPCWDTMKLKKEYNEKFIPCVKFNGNFAFGNKHFIENSGLHKDSVFYDEELIQSFNLIGNDTALVFINIDNFPLHHLYTESINEYGGYREYFSSMFGNKYGEYFSGRSVKNYLDYIKDPKNTKFIKKYEKYAKINVKLGAIINGYVPKVFIVEE